jgi:hypothetical protein
VPEPGVGGRGAIGLRRWESRSQALRTSRPAGHRRRLGSPIGYCVVHLLSWFVSLQNAKSPARVWRGRGDLHRPVWNRVGYGCANALPAPVLPRWCFSWSRPFPPRGRPMPRLPA